MHLAEEMSALESEDVHSSLSEAQQFMDLLNRNQQVRRQRKCQKLYLFFMCGGTQLWDCAFVNDSLHRVVATKI